MNRPFFRFKQDVRENTFFLDKSSVPQCLLFLFFKKRKRPPSRKENVPLLFFLEEKTVSLRGKRSPSDGRTQAYPALSSVGIPQRVCLPPPTCLCPCPPRLRASFPVQTDHAKENRLRLSFFSPLLSLSPTCNTKRTVHIRTVRFLVPYRTCRKASFLRLILCPAVSFVSFLQEKKSFPFQKKRNRTPSVTRQRNPG